MKKTFFLIILCIYILLGLALGIKKNAIRNLNKNFILNNNETNSEVVLKDGEVEAYCFVILDGIVYDLNPLYDANMDYIFKSGTNQSFYFNFCKFGVSKCKKDNTYIIAAKIDSLINNTTTDCTLLAGTNHENFPKWRILSKIIFFIIINLDNPGEFTKISIDLPEGDQCIYNNTSSYYTTTYEITCDRNTAKLSVDNLSTVSTNKCHNTIQIRSQYACPNFTKYSLHNTIKKNSVMFGLMILAIGIYYCFFSYKYIKVTRILTGVTIVCFISLFLFANNLEMNFSSANFWSVLIISVLIGLFLGWIISKVPWVVSSVLGAFLGFIFTELLYHMILSSLSWNPKAVYYIIFSCSVVLFAVLGGFFQKHIFIISCAFTGAYSIIRSLGTLENNFPDEKQLYDLIERSEWWQVNNMINYSFYLYICFAFILGCAGSYHQYKSYFKDIRGDDSEFNK